MQAIIQDRYGPPDWLELRELATPSLGDGEVLIQVRAAGLHVGDLFALRGSLVLVRVWTGWRRPTYGVPGFDLAGRIAAVGRSVTEWRVGDDVYGSAVGTAAEYVRAKPATLERLPAGLSAEEAAAIPTSALAALHGLRDAARVQPGQRVLINGASGGVGTFAIQIARWLGAEVTGVTGPSNVELVRSLGAEHVIDYRAEDFTRAGRRYDVILDNVENHPLGAVRRALAPRGTLVLNSGTGASGVGMLARLVRPLLLDPFTRQRLCRFLSEPNRADLAVLRDLAESGHLRPVIDRVVPLRDTPAALRHIAAGHASGKVVVTVAA